MQMKDFLNKIPIFGSNKSTTHPNIYSNNSTGGSPFTPTVLPGTIQFPNLPVTNPVTNPPSYPASTGRADTDWEAIMEQVRKLQREHELSQDPLPQQMKQMNAADAVAFIYAEFFNMGRVFKQQTSSLYHIMISNSVDKQHSNSFTEYYQNYMPNPFSTEYRSSYYELKMMNSAYRQHSRECGIIIDKGTNEILSLSPLRVQQYKRQMAFNRTENIHIDNVNYFQEDGSALQLNMHISYKSSNYEHHGIREVLEPFYYAFDLKSTHDNYNATFTKTDGSFVVIITGSGIESIEAVYDNGFGEDDKFNFDLMGLTQSLDACTSILKLNPKLHYY